MYSVIIPSFQRSHLIHDCISSVVQQTVKPNEIIIIDDHSADFFKTSQIISQIKGQTDVNIIIERNDRNMGACRSRNKGASKAISPFIAFLDDDDLWLPSKAETQLPTLKRGYAISCSNAMVLMQNGEKKPTKYKLIKHPKKLILQHNFICSPTNMVSKNVFEAVGGFNEDYVALQDRELWTRMIFYDDKVFLHDDILAVYRKHEGESIGKGPKVKEAYKMYLKDNLLRYVMGMNVRGLYNNIKCAI